jgi:serine/threonine protein phosphatase PrpC
VLKSYIKSLIGPRQNNEDYYLLRNFESLTLACISDGVGGNSCGEVASKLSSDLFCSTIEEVGVIDDLKGLVTRIDDQLKKYAMNHVECSGMATTLTACIIKDDLLKGVHVGDSRATILRAKGLKQLTDEHTESARLLKKGEITMPEFANHHQRNILTSALGSSRTLVIHEFEFRLLQHDRIILSTDGFHEVLGKLTLRDLSVNNPDINQFGQAILHFLEKSKLKDNCTFMILEVA